MELSINSDAKKVILVTSINYSSEYDEILTSLIKRKIELFCSIGIDCEKWEEALDWLCIGKNGEEVGFVTTTSHPNETLEEVMEFANNWQTDGNHETQIIKI